MPFCFSGSGLRIVRVPFPRRSDAPYPGDRAFGFTILDDTDDATLENVKPLYDLLDALGLRTTKTVWPLDCPEGSAQYFAATTMADDAYREWVVGLQARGFEITWHCATMESSTRERTVRGLEAFRDMLGHYPEVHCNHGQNRENVYWGPRRYRNPLLRAMQRAKGRGRDPEFEGDVEGSPFFWGDLCRERCRWVRGFTFHEIDTLAADPELVYQLDSTPWVRCWFSTSDAADVHEFNRLVTPDAIDRLHAARGVCILSTHLGKGFVRAGRVDPRVERTLRHLASLPGWFVPTGTMLAHFEARAPRLRRPYTRHFLRELEHAADRLRGLR